VHVTLKVRPEAGNLRHSRVYRAIRGAITLANGREDFRVTDFTVQGNHLHFLCEADDRVALSRGMQGLSIRAARAINRGLGRSGKVFAERYHARILRSPTEVRAVLVYIYQNTRKHAAGRVTDPDYVDPCTSAAWFTGWEVPIRDLRLRPEGVPPVRPPETWLRSKGWQRLGLLRFDEGVSAGA
jgi:REP element-mobilizing transposase RayT